MKKIIALLLFVAISSAVFAQSDTVIQDKTFSYVYSDSLTFNQKDNPNLILINKKQNETTIIIKGEDGRNVLEKVLHPKQENEIKIQNLNKGIYTIECYDQVGLVLRSRFIKNRRI